MKGDRIKIFSVAMLLVAALTALYLNHFDNAFHFDDFHTIVDNEYISHVENIPLFFKDARTESSLPTNQSYRPVIASLNAIDYWIAGGLNPRVFHWHIYLEFLLLLYLIFRFFGHVFAAASGSSHPYVALFATAFFAFHTATAETINYIIARSDGFSTLMVVAGALLYIGLNGWKRQLGLIPFVVGCLAKPTTLMLAPLLAVYSLLLETPSLTVPGEPRRMPAALARTVKGTWAYFLLGAAMYLFTRSMYPPTWTPGNESPLHYLNTQPYVIWIYLKTFVWPTGLSADTDLEIIREYLAPRVVWGLLIIAVLLICAWFAARSKRSLPIAYGILWFFIALIPSSSIIPLAEVMNHHRTFFPYIGLVMAFTWSAYLLLQKLAGETFSLGLKAVVAALALILLGLHAYGTYQRNEVWDSDSSLWRDVTIKSPNNGRGLMNYGLTKMRTGDMEEAIDLFRKAQNTSYRNHPYLYTNLGIATNGLADRTGSPALKSEAENYFKRALQLGPNYPQTQYRYGEWLYRNDRPMEALPYLRKALELSPALKEARDLYERIDQSTEEGIAQARSRAEAANSPEAFLDLSLSYYNLGRYRECIEASNAALHLKPDYALAYNNICSAQIMLGQYEDAVRACEKALELDPDFTLARNNLAWARKEQAQRH